MATLVFFLLVFFIVSIVFLFIHMMMGKVIRPSRPEADKLTIYECGEPTIGTAWIQFDLRYYVVALLFVIFDVEVAFFFPWAITFGKANDLSRPDMPAEKRAAVSQQIRPAGLPMVSGGDQTTGPIEAATAREFAWTAMIDIVVFFSVLLVGFAYLWRRGDIDWVKTLAAEKGAEPPPEAPVLPKPVAAHVSAPPAPALAAAGKN